MVTASIADCCLCASEACFQPVKRFQIMHERIPDDQANPRKEVFSLVIANALRLPSRPAMEMAASAVTTDSANWRELKFRQPAWFLPAAPTNFHSFTASWHGRHEQGVSTHDPRAFHMPRARMMDAHSILTLPGNFIRLAIRGKR